MTFGLACPHCGSKPLLGAPTDRHAWLCPRCLTYWTTDLVLVPRKAAEPAVMNAAAKVRQPREARDPKQPWSADGKRRDYPPAVGAVRRPTSAGPDPGPGQLPLAFG